MLVIDISLVLKWSNSYDYRFGGGKAKTEGKAIRDWLSKQKEPKYLKRENYVRLHRWESARVTKHYEANSSKEITELTRNAYLISYELLKLKLLMTLKGVRVPVALTILHYL